MDPGAALARLRSVTGIGPWTAAEVARAAFGDPDAVSLGDFHVPDMVCWALAGEPRGDDTRMLELLEPYRGQRARVVRIIERSGIKAPRYGPRTPVRHIDRSGRRLHHRIRRRLRHRLAAVRDARSS